MCAKVAAVASVAWPHKLTSHVGVNHRKLNWLHRSKLLPSHETNAVSLTKEINAHSNAFKTHLRLNSPDISRYSDSSKILSTKTTAAGFPLNETFENASTI